MAGLPPGAEGVPRIASMVFVAVSFPDRLCWWSVVDSEEGTGNTPMSRVSPSTPPCWRPGPGGGSCIGCSNAAMADTSEALPRDRVS